MHRIFLIWVPLLVICFLPRLSAQELNILDFGAVPDGKTLNTLAIQSAIDSLSQEGGGRIIIPRGIFLTGALNLKSGTHLYLHEEAVLLGSTLPEHYFKLNRWKALIIADGEENIGILGKGEINGQGRQLALHLDSLFYAGQLDSADYNFNEMRPKYYLRPQLIEFVDCKDIEVRNVTLKNAACWVQTHHNCENIVIDSVKTISDAYWNNDGIDIQDCRKVRITNCFVNSADDGICLKSHEADRYCDSIYIANCTVRSSASALKFGTRSHGGFKNVVIENIKVFDTFRSAIAIECVDGAFLENVLIDGVEATNTGNALFIRLGKRHTSKAGTLREVTLRNIQVEVPLERPDYAYEIRGPELPFFHNLFPSSITGIPGHPVENVTLENISIHFAGGGNKGLAYMPLSRMEQVPEKESSYPEFSMFGELPAWGLYVRHVRGLQMKNISLNLETPDYRPALVFDDVQDLQIQSLSIEGDNKVKQIILRKTNAKDIEGQKLIWEQE